MQILPRQKKNGKTSYTVRIRVQGYPPLSKTFPTHREAISWGKTAEGDLLAGRLGSPLAQLHTLRDAIERFLEEKPPGYGSWLQKERNRASLRWWCQHFGGLKLAELKPTTIVQARDLLRRSATANGKPHPHKKLRSHSTCNRYVSSLSAVLQCALELWGWIEENPCRGLRRLPENNHRTRYLTEKEQQRLLRVCKSDSNLHDVVLLALLTGARRGEICGLRWRDVDLKNRTVTFVQTKNGEIRKVPLSDPAIALLQCRFSQRVKGMNDWVFPAEKSEGSVDVSHRFGRYAKKAGLEDFRFHDLRHSAASAMARAGVPERQMQEVLGHKSVAMTKRYTHLRPSELDEAVAAMGTSIKNQGEE